MKTSHLHYFILGTKKKGGAPATGGRYTQHQIMTFVKGWPLSIFLYHFYNGEHLNHVSIFSIVHYEKHGFYMSVKPRQCSRFWGKAFLNWKLSGLRGQTQIVWMIVNCWKTPTTSKMKNMNKKKPVIWELISLPCFFFTEVLLSYVKLLSMPLF